MGAWLDVQGKEKIHDNLNNSEDRGGRKGRGRKAGRRKHAIEKASEKNGVRAQKGELLVA